MSDDQSKNRYYRSLLRNVVLTILLTAITPTIIVSLFILDEFRTSYEKKVHDHLELLVRKHKKNIDMFLEEKLMDIRMLAGANRFESLRDESFLNRKFDEMQKAFDRTFVDLGVVDHKGRQIAYAGPHGLTGVSYSDTDWFKQAINSPYFISDVFKGLRGEPHFIVTVRHVYEGNPWILRAHDRFRGIQQPGGVSSHWRHWICLHFEQRRSFSDQPDGQCDTGRKIGLVARYS
jgi:two-component system NtrC family sensor kinase